MIKHHFLLNAYIFSFTSFYISLTFNKSGISEFQILTLSKPQFLTYNFLTYQYYYLLLFLAKAFDPL